MAAPLRSSSSPAARRSRRGAAAAVLAAATLALVPAAGAQAAGTGAVARAHWTTTHLSGTRGTLTWNVAIPRFTGGGAPTAVNRRVRASAVATIDATARDAASNASTGDTSAQTLDGVSAVTTNDGRTVQVRLDYDDFAAGAAHPYDTVSTVALLARTGRPITLDQVFTNSSHAYRVLAPVIERIAAAASEPVTDTSGLAPRTSNWAAWQTTPEGMVFAFQDYQLGGHGIRTYTVPWSTARPLMTASARALLAPSAA